MRLPTTVDRRPTEVPVRNLLLDNLDDGAPVQAFLIRFQGVRDHSVDCEYNRIRYIAVGVRLSDGEASDVRMALVRNLTWTFRDQWQNGNAKQ